MKTYLVATITCPDRPGIVERMTEVLVAYSANWEESRMAHLGGDFAGIVKISVAHKNAVALAEALRNLSDDEMTVTVKETQAGAADPRPSHSLCQLRVSGADHEGIVHSVARTLVQQGINVEDMETEVSAAPMSAVPLFHMEAQVKVPPDRPLAVLRAELERIGEELSVDIEIDPLT